MVAGLLDRGEHVVDGDDGRVEGDGGLVGRVVDSGLDAVEVVQPAFDPGGARGARHALELETHRLASLCVQRGH